MRLKVPSPKAGSSKRDSKHMSEASLSSGNAAVFLDRDGVLIEDCGYLSDVAGVKIIPGVPKALRRLVEAGFVLFIVTNQSGIGRGYYTEADMHAIHRHLEEVLAAEGVEFREIYFAPEAPEQPSRGRKPSPQFLFDARDAFAIDLSRSFMVGDKFSDLECGWNAGVKCSILVRTGQGTKTERERANSLRNALVVKDLPEAVDILIK